MKNKEYLGQLKHTYPGFRVLRGYFFEREGKNSGLILLLVKTKKPRTGVFTKFVNDRIAEGLSVIVYNPTTEAMFEFLKKNKFFFLYRYEDNREAWIKTPFDIDLAANGLWPEE